MKFGGELRRDQIKVSFINRPNGDFTFAGTQYTGNAAADFLLGFPTQYRQATGDPNLDGSSWVYAALRPGRVPDLAGHAELRPPLRGEPAVRGERRII